jgi:hypothetical protein
MLARQVLYHLSHTSNPFCSGEFGDWFSLFAQASLDQDFPFFTLPYVTEMTGMYHHAQHFSIEMGSGKCSFLPSPAQHHDPPISAPTNS